MKRLGIVLVLVPLVATASAPLLPAQAGAADSAWSVQPSPNRQGIIPSDLTGASCPSPTFCVAVGFDLEGRTLIQSRAGAGWSIVPSPNVKSAENNELNGVSCVSVAFCAAVGYVLGDDQAPHPLAEMWNGSTWRIALGLSTGTLGQLMGVSCSSSTSCIAVGSSFAGRTTLIESWNGSTWSVVPSPSPRPGSELFGVSCASSSFCVGVGIQFDNGLSQTLIESSDGAAWSMVPSPSPGDNGNGLNGVSCLSADSCIAVGEFYIDSQSAQTLVESWDGTSWSVVPSPSPPKAGAYLQGVSCVSPTFCMAAGKAQIVSGYSTLIESWNGSAWSILPSPNPQRSNGLLGVSCPSTTSCAAVGFTDGIRIEQALIEGWDGKAWSVVPSPSVKGTVGNELNGASCPSAGSCTAVGYYYTAGVSQTLIASENGAAGWSLVPSPNPGPGVDIVNELLQGVSCISSSFCVAVGRGEGYGLGRHRSQTLIESWDGASWSVAPSPNPGIGNSLGGVSCVSSSFCVAVGSYAGITFDFRTLVESWDGSTWSVVPSPNPNPGTYDVLNSVSCVSATYCSAVGEYYDGNNQFTLIESWDGSTWSIVPSPSPGSYPVLSSVSCVSATYCSAVGEYYDGNNEVTLIESWDGSTWSVVPSPNPGEYRNTLNGVSCASPTFCVAAGYYGAGPSQAFIESWDGASWTVVPSPSPGTSSLLFGVSCASASACVAVGAYVTTDRALRTLIETNA